MRRRRVAGPRRTAARRSSFPPCHGNRPLRRGLCVCVSACVAATCHLPSLPGFQLAVRRGRQQAGGLAGCFFSPPSTDRCDRTRTPAPAPVPNAALPLILTVPGSEILAVPSRYVQPRHPLPRPSVRPSVRAYAVARRAGSEMAERSRSLRANVPSEQAYGLHSLPKESRSPTLHWVPHSRGCTLRQRKMVFGGGTLPLM